MFRLATCADLIHLKVKYPGHWITFQDIELIQLKYPDFLFFEELNWGLKQAGTLLCVEHIETYKPQKILEVGAGFNTFFDRHYGQTCESWMVDESGFYDTGLLDKANQARCHTRFVSGLLGQQKSELPGHYFDMVFSISVLEHIPASEISSVCQDMARILKPGGWIVHSIDLSPQRSLTLGQQWYEELQKAGFLLNEPFDLKWDFFVPWQNQVLLEPLSIVYQYYGGKLDDLWSKPKQSNHYYGSILVQAQLGGDR